MESKPPSSPVAIPPSASTPVGDVVTQHYGTAWRWVVGIVGALVFVGGTALAAVEFSSGGGAAGLFGGSGLGAFGLLLMIVAKDGAV